MRAKSGNRTPDLAINFMRLRAKICAVICAQAVCDALWSIGLYKFLPFGEGLRAARGSLYAVCKAAPSACRLKFLRRLTFARL